jgi:type IV pilus biogenesis protein CpaD/CtpE
MSFNKTIAVKAASRISFLLGAALLMFGCAANDPVRVEQDFGNSVRHMVKSQIYNPEAAQNPPALPPTAFDGEKGENVLESYRGDVAKPKEVKRPITIDVGD